jgi:hypothetical protein
LRLLRDWRCYQEEGYEQLLIPLFISAIQRFLEHFLKWCRPESRWFPTHFRKKRGNGWGTEVYSKCENALERNQSPYILMNLVEGRHSLVLAST